MWLKRKPTPPVSAEHMHAIAVGEGGALELVAAPRPEAKPEEVLIKVAYAGVNRADILQRQGLYPPPEDASSILGLEVSGYVAGFGAKAIGWTVGEPVFALTNGGAYAEYVAVPQGLVMPAPPRLSMQEAASLPESCITAWMALVQEGRVRDGEVVLVHGAASGVGIMLVQLAQLLGAKVLGVVGSKEKATLMKQLGATAINHREVDFDAEAMRLTQDKGVDVIIDILGGSRVATHLKLLKKGGRLVSLAFMEGNVAENLPLSRLLTRHLRWSGTTLRGQSLEAKIELMEAVRKRMMPYFATGAIRPVLDQTFLLAEADAAHTRMQERLHCGKILLEVSAPE